MILHREDFDNKIKEFVTKWEDSTCDAEESAIKKSLTFYLIEELYKYFRENVFQESTDYLKKRKLDRFRSVSEMIQHILWYILFSLKWLFILPFSWNDKFIMLSLLPDKKHSLKYIDALINIESHKDTNLIHFGIFYNWQLLFNSRFYCYPHFFYRFFIKRINYSMYYRELQKKVEDAVSKHFETRSNIYLTNKLTQLSKIHTSFSFLIRYLKQKGNILFFIQDLDFILNGFIYNYCCRLNRIKSISIDHAILVTKHYFINRSSDCYLVWGKYQEKRLQNISKIDSEKIRIVGNPTKTFKIERTSPKDTLNWLYLMQGYQYAIVHNINRALIDTMNNLRRLEQLLPILNPKGKLFVKPHPLDSLLEKHIKQKNLFYGNLHEILPKIGVVFFEDTSAVVDCLPYPINLIYLSDRTESTNIFDFRNIFNTITVNDDWVLKINEFDKKEFDMEKRKSLHNYFYGNSELFSESLNNSLMDLLHCPRRV